MTSAASLLSRIALVAMLLGSVVSCSSVSKGPGGQVSKANHYHLQPLEQLNTRDPSVLFERAHYLYGAVTLAEQLERAGHYYTFWWKVDDRSQPVTVKFEYRQKLTGLAVKVKEEQVTELSRSNRTKFQVIGPEYQTDGPVTSWQVSILRGKEVLASQQSFTWN
jgi:hypothetical protein